jgi:uncharacterized integral membrane protein
LNSPFNSAELKRLLLHGFCRYSGVASANREAFVSFAGTWTNGQLAGKVPRHARLSGCAETFWRHCIVHSRFGSIVLIVIGLIFLLHNLNILSFRYLGELLRTWWPAILILVGVLGLMGKRK